MIRRALILLLTAMLLVCSLSLVGCSGSDDAEEPGTSDAQSGDVAPDGSPLAPAEGAQEAADEANEAIEERTGEIDDE